MKDRANLKILYESDVTEITGKQLMKHRDICRAEGRKQGALGFAYWLVNAPNKEIHSKKWIEQKYEQYLKEQKEKELEGVEK